MSCRSQAHEIRIDHISAGHCSLPTAYWPPNAASAAPPATTAGAFSRSQLISAATSSPVSSRDVPFEVPECREELGKQGADRHAPAYLADRDEAIRAFARTQDDDAVRILAGHRAEDRAGRLIRSAYYCSFHHRDLPRTAIVAAKGEGLLRRAEQLTL